MFVHTTPATSQALNVSKAFEIQPAFAVESDGSSAHPTSPTKSLCPCFVAKRWAAPKISFTDRHSPVRLYPSTPIRSTLRGRNLAPLGGSWLKFPAAATHTHTAFVTRSALKAFLTRL